MWFWKKNKVEKVETKHTIYYIKIITKEYEYVSPGVTDYNLVKNALAKAERQLCLGINSLADFITIGPHIIKKFDIKSISINTKYDTNIVDDLETFKLKNWSE
jgi:hypothetical protein